jgi:hypothetical protein
MKEETVRRVVLIVVAALLVGGATTAAAAGKGAGQLVAPGGVTTQGSTYRYTTMSPRVPRKLTVVVQIDRDGGRVSRWWHLPGSYHLPAVAYDLSGSSLSADGSTLVLARFSRAYPPRTSSFAILDTRLHLRHPLRPGEQRPAHAITHVGLRGDFSFDAISPDGSTIYLIQHLPRFKRPRYITNYEVRALDTESGELLPGPIVDPSEPDERMQGLPITRAASPDGRWAYTLYDGNGEEPFIHALDTVEGVAVCIDLPQLAGQPNRFLLGLRTERGGQDLAVLNHPATQRGSRPLLVVDTRSFEVSEPSLDAAPGGSVPWLPIGLSALALAATIAWITRRGRGTDPRESLGQT